jgi:serine protease 12 (motopsin)
MNQSYSFVDGLSSTGGIVQVCINQQFGYICADGWDDREAEVVCRSQGFQAPFYGMVHLF